MQTIGNYFHIPFCKKKCPYCHFYVIPDKEAHKRIFLEALHKEWLLRSFKGMRVSTLYLGGGTPSLFPEAAEAILRWVKPYLTEDAEITMEANPEDMTPLLAQKLFALGINRVSMGVQSLSDSMLHTLGRTHSASKALSAIQNLYDAGITNISIDLMYDLPSQTLASWQNTLQRIGDLPITHLSLYNLTLEPHTVFFKKRKELILPDDETSLQMLQTAVETLESFGLNRYEISAFAKPGYMARHNTGYWTGRPFLGFGPSAFSYWEGKRFRNVAHLLRYSQSLDEGKDPVDFSECLPKEESQAELFAVELRLLQGIDIAAFEGKNGSISSALHNRLKQIEDFLFYDGKIAKLTEKGLLFYDSVAAEIIA